MAFVTDFEKILLYRHLGDLDKNCPNREYQYVQELGGKIQVESQQGKGTRVTIMLPLFDNQKHSDLRMMEPQ
ncbi:MAG: hypothetical protein ACOYNF_12670 [Rhodoferax sp.]